jgi:hypothetical protein
MILGFLKRLFLFQFIFVIAFLQFKDMNKSANIFKGKVRDFTNSTGIKNNIIEELLSSNHLLIFQAFIGIKVFTALIALFGSRFFSFVTGILVALSTLIYANPISILQNYKESQKPGSKIQFHIPIEALLLTGLTLAILAQSFYYQPRRTKAVPTHETIPEEKNSARTPKENSKTKKKKHI